jgi:hypothetical protein
MRFKSATVLDFKDLGQFVLRFFLGVRRIRAIGDSFRDALRKPRFYDDAQQCVQAPHPGLTLDLGVLVFITR